MSYTITIEYTGTETDEAKISAQIAGGLHCPCGSYINSPVFVEGYPVDADADDKEYGKSVYANQVFGNGDTAVPEPYATTSIPMSSPLAQFKLAAISEDGTVTFTTDDYKEAFYYATLGGQLANQGFVVTMDSDEDDSSDGDPD